MSRAPPKGARPVPGLIISPVVMCRIALALVISTISWQDLSFYAQKLAVELGFKPASFAQSVETIRSRNSARLREGEIDHLIFYLLQSTEFTSVPSINPAVAAVNDAAVRSRMSDLVRALIKPSSERQQYVATLLPPSHPEAFLEREFSRVLKWIHDKEVGCRSAESPQSCIAALYTTRGHSSDTSPQSMAPVRAAWGWLIKERPIHPRRVLIIGPGSDFAARTALKPGPVQSFQPAALKALLPDATVDCLDLNPRVVRAVSEECDAALEADISIHRSDVTYDLIVATNVLLYLDDKELLLAMQNVRSMLAPTGSFVHNDTRFQTNLFGRAVGLPVLHFGSVTVDAIHKPPLIDHFVIHSPAAPKL